MPFANSATEKDSEYLLLVVEGGAGVGWWGGVWRGKGREILSK